MNGLVYGINSMFSCIKGIVVVKKYFIKIIET